MKEAVTVPDRLQVALALDIDTVHDILKSLHAELNVSRANAPSVIMEV